MKVDSQVRRMTWMYVVPLSLIPVAMFIYAVHVTSGAALPMVVPVMSLGEAASVGVLLFVIEIGTVALMASIIQQLGNVVDARPDYRHSYMLAAIAPTPLWLAPLAVFVPLVWFNGIVFVAAWIGSATLIYRGVGPLFKLDEQRRARLMAAFILLAGVIAWATLMVMLTLIIGLMIALR